MCWKVFLSRTLLIALSALALGHIGGTLAHSSDEQPSAAYANGGDFTLLAPDGPLSLSDLRGTVVLIFFGYTSCPDVCPISLARINASFKKLSDKELNKVRALFITLDPERDTRERLEKYVGYFHPNIIGLRDEPRVVSNVARQFGVNYSKKPAPDSALGYTISHPTDILLLDRHGQLVKAFPHDTDVGTLVSSIRGLLDAAN